MPPGTQRRQGQRRVAPVRRADIDGLQIVTRQQCGSILYHFGDGKPCRQRLGGTPPSGSDGHHLRGDDAQTAVADPFAGYPKPDGRSYNGVNTLPTNPAQIGGTTTWPEGIYTGTLSGNLCHGIYILKGGGFNGVGIDTNNAHVDANTNTPCDGKVLVYNTMSAWPATTGTCSNLTGNSVLLPMTTGTYAYLGIYQDPACAASLTVSGSSSISVAGTIYMPSGAISLSGNPATINGGQLIAQTINVQNGNLNVYFVPGLTASPKLPRLAE